MHSIDLGIASKIGSVHIYGRLCNPSVHCDPLHVLSPQTHVSMVCFAIHSSEVRFLVIYILTIPRTWKVETKSFKLWSNLLQRLTSLMCSIWSLVSPKSKILGLPPGFYGRFASLRSAWKGLDQARLHLTLSRHIIFGFAPRILGPLCLASLGLEGIRSSSFTFDSLTGYN